MAPADETPAAREERLQRLVREVLDLVNRAQLEHDEARHALAHAYACTVAEQYERTSFLTRDELAQRWARELGEKINAFVLQRRAS